MTGRLALRTLAGLLLVGAAACAPARPRLPAGPWSPAPDAVGWLAEASSRCAAVRSLTAEVAVSGRAGGTRVRGRLIAGLERPGSVRLEAPAPFGAPVFILAAREDRGVLYFPRDRRVLTDAAVADVLEALAGIPRGAGDLRALLTGCLVADRRPSGGRESGGRWAQVDLGDGVAAVLERRDGRWRMAGGRQSGSGAWSVEYADMLAGFPRTIRFATGGDGASGDRATALTLKVSQLETNVPIDETAFTFETPAGASPLSLAELRQMGPLADRREERP